MEKWGVFMISIQNVSFQYDDSETKSLENIDLEIQKGKCILLCGRSGCGKTTVIRLLNGLSPQFFHGQLDGQILMDQQNIFQIPMYELAKKTGSVFQNPRTQFFNIDVDSEIAFGIENQGLSEKLLKKRVETAFMDLHIENLKGANLYELSGGEKQKIAFASVYAMNSDLYLLDEPSSNLDHEATKSLHGYIKLLKSQNKTIVIAEHRLYYLMDLIDEAVYLENGKIKKIYKQDEFMKISMQQREKMGLRTFDLLDTTFSYQTISSLKQNSLILKDVSLFYKKRCVLQNVSIQAKEGEIIGIIGPNGAGKTTFSRMLCGLHKNLTGKIFWHNKQQNDKERMKLAYLVMQDVNYQLFGESVYEECRLGIENPDSQKIDETLAMLDLLDLKNKHPHTLSGGQKQRVAVAASMICQKEWLIFDEPTSGLDYDAMKQVSNLLKKLAVLNKVIFVVTHDYEFLCQCCHRVIHFDDRRLCHDFILNEKSQKLLNEIMEGKR